MGTIHSVTPVKLICGMIAAGREMLPVATQALQAAFGEIDIESDIFPFDCTDYYAREMGPELVRQFVAFTVLVDPGRLAAIKQQTNAIEQQLSVAVESGSRRPVNLDPGYVAAAQLVLATTKNFAHRIYIGNGIYAEVTLLFHRSGCRTLPWTYPDFRSGRYDAFFLEVRRRLFRQQRTKHLTPNPAQKHLEPDRNQDGTHNRNNTQKNCSQGEHT